ncbi:MAG: UDP-N-acetylglucosamine 1-carboxyvinyltransferase [Minisyncoccia bacterium]
MGYFLIEGGKKLSGKIKVGGSKNAVLPILVGSILNKGRTILDNVPKIADVFVIIEILKHLGAEIEWQNNSLIINSEKVHYEDCRIDAFRKLRASILFLGPMLALFKKVKMFRPGGDIIGARPIDVHINTLKNLGCEIKTNEALEGRFGKLKSYEVRLKEISVTATETLLLFLSLIPKRVKIRLAAIEPHVVSLCLFLKLLGVKIKGIGTHFLEIEGREKIKRNIRFKIPPDQIETGTFVALAAATRSRIEILDIKEEDLDALFILMDEMKIKYELGKNSLKVFPSDIVGTKIQTGLHPKFPTDMQPPFGVLATQAKGVTLIHDWLYENRFSYVNELIYMGANAEILDPHRAIFIGPTPLKGKEVKSLDIRSGIALIIAGLVASGETIIQEAEKIDRGYEKIEERLKKLGAKIQRFD